MNISQNIGVLMMLVPMLAVLAFIIFALCTLAILSFLENVKKALCGERRAMIKIAFYAMVLWFIVASFLAIFT